MKKSLSFLLAVFAFQIVAFSSNPIIKNKGANDPHIHIFNGKAYLSASHDKSIGSNTFSMDDWWLWSSDDLVDWKLESVLKPEDIAISAIHSSAMYITRIMAKWC